LVAAERCWLNAFRVSFEPTASRLFSANPTKLKVCQATAAASSQGAAAKRLAQPGSACNANKSISPMTGRNPNQLESGRRVQSRAKDHGRQWYRDHDMVRVKPSIGTLISLS
jgi:hypothetical protein